MDKFQQNSTPETNPVADSESISLHKHVIHRRHAQRSFSFSSPETEKKEVLSERGIGLEEAAFAPAQAPIESTASSSVPEASSLFAERAAEDDSSLPAEEPSVESSNAAAALKEEIDISQLYKDQSPDNDETEEVLSGQANLFDWIKSFLFSLTAVIFIFTLIFRGVTVSGDSMLPTLEDQEYLIISDLMYQPKTGDIVVVQSPNYKKGTEPLIKRVIATGGQTLKINFKTWQIWVDGVELQEDYIAFEEGLNMNPEDLEVNENFEAELVIEDNCIFVMGDHRNDSLDSRSMAVGQIDQRYIMGRVLLRVTPFSKFGKVE